MQRAFGLIRRGPWEDHDPFAVSRHIEALTHAVAAGLCVGDHVRGLPALNERRTVKVSCTNHTESTLVSEARSTAGQ